MVLGILQLICISIWVRVIVGGTRELLLLVLIFYLSSDFLLNFLLQFIFELQFQFTLDGSSHEVLVPLYGSLFCHEITLDSTICESQLIWELLTIKIHSYLLNTCLGNII
jgi:hypothetical protein